MAQDPLLRGRDFVRRDLRRRSIEVNVEVEIGLVEITDDR